MTSREAWQVGSRGASCAGCSAGFTPGADVVSALFDAAEEGFTRGDYCDACFASLDVEARPFSWWRAPLPEPESDRAVFDLSVAREFLVRLLREGDPERASLRYLLTLLLLRKRGVKVVEQFSDERGDVMVVTLPPEDATWEVPCPELDEAETETLRDELGRLFDL